MELDIGKQCFGTGESTYVPPFQVLLPRFTKMIRILTFSKEEGNYLSIEMIAETPNAINFYLQNTFDIRFGVLSSSANGGYGYTERMLEDTETHPGLRIVADKPSTRSSVPSIRHFHNHHGNRLFRRQNSGNCFLATTTNFAYQMDLYRCSSSRKAAEIASLLMNALVLFPHTLASISSASNDIETSVLSFALRRIPNYMYSFGFLDVFSGSHWYFFHPRNHSRHYSGLDHVIFIDISKGIIIYSADSCHLSLSMASLKLCGGDERLNPFISRL